MRPVPGLAAVEPHPVSLLILQSTPFCNLDCSYCYLPDRADKRRMSIETVHAVGREVLMAGRSSQELTVIWHAGEPLTVPLSWYSEAHSVLGQYAPEGVRITHAFQTNGTLIDKAWVDWFGKHHARVGISIDGPVELHDAQRKGRTGKGSFENGMRGLRLVRDAGQPFHVISVLNAKSLAMPDELFDFYASERIHNICFNVEEIEGQNAASSLASAGVEEAYAAFLRRFMERCSTSPHPPWVREIDHGISGLMMSPARVAGNAQVDPLAMLSVGVDGALSTFSPELLGARAPAYDDFCFGNIHVGGMTAMLSSPALQAAARDIAAGVRACRDQCAWFKWCGGGAPANKWFETGSLGSTETLYCRLTRKVLLGTILQELEAGHIPPSRGGKP